ncbi:ABC transporter permease, partial [Patescibacteria group bacterium]
MNILRRMAYRLNFFIFFFTVTLHLAVYLIFIKIIYGHVTSIAGWDLYHSLLIIASAMIIEALCWITCRMMLNIGKDVVNGNMDFHIVKPIDIQFLVSVNILDPEDISRFVLGLIVLFYALNNIKVSIVDFILYIFLLILAFIITYSILTIVATISFFVIDARAMHMVSMRILQISQYPTDIYTGIMKTVFSFIIPIAFIATVPAKVLSGWWNWTLVAQSFLLAIIFFYVSRKFFLFGLSRYSSASS